MNVRIVAKYARWQIVIYTAVGKIDRLLGIGSKVKIIGVEMAMTNGVEKAGVDAII